MTIRSFSLVATLVVLTLSLSAQSEIPGINGFQFTETDTSYAITVSDTFSVHGIEVRPNGLSLAYDPSTSTFTMYGDVELAFDGEEITAVLGSALTPGLVITSGSLTSVSFGITTDFTMKGLTIQAKDLTFEWSGGTEYKLYGDADLTISGDEIDCDMGTSSSPGLICVNGVITELNLNVNSDITFGNLEVTTKDLDISYSNSRYELTGSISVDELFSIGVTLGDGSTPGIVLDVSGAQPRLKIEEVTLKISHANLGAIDLKNFILAFNTFGIIESDVEVHFPSGFGVGAKLSFVGAPARLNAITIDYEATSASDAEAMTDGLLLAKMSGTMQNLAYPSDLSFSGDMILLFAGPFSLDGKEAALIYLKSGVTIDRREFVVKGDAKLGAYKSGSSWHSLLGEGSATLTIVWGKHTKFSGTLKIPSHRIVEMKPHAYIDHRRNLDARLHVSFYVPHSIPIVGGKKIGSADGALRYHHGDLHRSFAAAWVSGKILWHHYTVGAEYNFGHRKIKTIGSGTVSSIKKDISRDIHSKRIGNAAGKQTAALTVSNVSHSFTTLAPNPASLLIEVSWPKLIDTVLVTVVGPEGYYELTRAYGPSEDSVGSFSDPAQIETNLALVTQDTSATFIVSSASSFNYDSVMTPTLIPGEYRVVCSSYDVGIDSMKISVIPMYDPPTVNVAVSGIEGGTEAPNVGVSFWSVQPESTIVSVYASDQNAYAGRSLGTFTDFVKNNNLYSCGTAYSHDQENDWTPDSDSLWFYAVIEDGVNPPLLSDIEGPFYYPAAVNGSISVSSGADTIAHGLLVFLDADGDGNWDSESTGGRESTAVTDANGHFKFPSLPPGESFLRVLVPSGYSLYKNGVPVDSVPITNIGGTPQTILMQLQPGATE